MTDYPRAQAAGVRKAPRHEIAGWGRRWCRGRYGDFAAGSGGRVLKGSGSAVSIAWPHEQDRWCERATSIFRDEILGLWVVIAEQSGVVTQALMLSAEGQHV